MEKQKIQDKLQKLYKDLDLVKSLAAQGSERHRLVLLPDLETKIESLENQLKYLLNEE